jgi:Uma2 family endonuclease
MVMQRDPVLTACPPLESGDHLTRDEFERRYALRPDIKKAELIGGVVYVASPVRIDEHAEPHGILGAWLQNYAATHSGVRAANDGTVRLGPDDNVQPDILVWHERPGSSRLDDDHFFVGPPELVVEIAASSATKDLHEKKEAYRQAGVQEYIVWQTLEERIDWWELQAGRYVPVHADVDGYTNSRVFPGLHLHLPRLLDGDRTVILPS